MKMILHHLRKELTVSRFLIAILAVVQLIRLAVLLGWAGSPAGSLDGLSVAPSGLEAFIVYGCFGLISPLVMMVLVVDSPFRMEGFLRTRPVKRSEVVIAKMLTVLLAVLGPVLLVDAIHLASAGFTVGEIGVGLLQSGLSLGGLMLGLIAFVWLWRTKREVWLGGVGVAMIGVGSVSLGGFLTYLSLRHHPGNPVENVFEQGFSGPRMLLGGYLVAAVWWVILLTGWRRAGLGLRVAGAGGVLAAVLVGLWLWPHKPLQVDDQGALGFAIPAIYEWQDENGTPRVSFGVEPGMKEMPGMRTERWEIAGLQMNGRDVPIRVGPDPRRHAADSIPWDRSRFLGTFALRKDLENDPLVVSNQVGGIDVPAAQAFVPLDQLSEGSNKVASTLYRHRFQWKQVAELPVAIGVRSGNWELEDLDTLGLWEQDEVPGRLRMSLSVHGKNLWLSGEVNRVYPRGLRALLIDDARGVCLPVEQLRRTSTVGSLTGAPWFGLRMEFEGRGLEGFPRDFEGCRVLIFEARWESSVAFDWSGEVKERPLPESGGLAREARDGTFEAFDVWLASHPAPGPDASEREVARHLVSILEQANQLPKRVPEGHEAERRIVTMVPAHLFLLMRAHGKLALDHHVSRHLLERAMARGIDEGDLTMHLRELVEMSEVRKVAWEKGWFEPLAEQLADGARLGSDTMFHQALRLPDRAGLSIDECLSLFRRNPQRWPYMSVRDSAELKPLVDAEIDQWLESTLRRVSAFSGNIDPALKLALERGHPDGPAMLQRLLKHAVTDDMRAHGFQSIMYQYFVRSERADHPVKWVKWFTEIDAKRFVFDEKEGKYRLSEERKEQEQ
ncbi:MAG: hypothetical protein AAGI48_16615 [Verrucomicrobiota bacterium]